MCVLLLWQYLLTFLLKLAGEKEIFLKSFVYSILSQLYLIYRIQHQEVLVVISDVVVTVPEFENKNYFIFSHLFFVQSHTCSFSLCILHKSSSYIILFLHHFSQATISIEISNFLIFSVVLHCLVLYRTWNSKFYWKSVNWFVLFH